jgi:hypothetical protein
MKRVLRREGPRASLSNGNERPSGQDRHAGHAISRGHAEASAIQGARALSRFLLVKVSPIGSELNDIGVASNAPVEVNNNNLGRKHE